jgi:hypothetical protein
MQKFYVTSGGCQKVVGSRDAQSAALWSLHQFLDEHVDLDSIDWFDESEIDNLELIQALVSLGEEFCVSEIGFGRSEAGYFDTADIMTHWQHLMIAVNRMDQFWGDDAAN